MIDGHTHLWGLANVENLERIREHIGAEAMLLACIYTPKGVSGNAAGFAAKAQHPDRFYLFPGLDHSAYFSGGRLAPPPLEEQVDRLMEAGADGIKLLETKPDRRKLLDVRIDSDYFERFFARVEERRMPLLWHVADPPEFWDAELTPRWAAEKGWGYNDTFVPWAQLYEEVETVLERHPGLRVTFPHFFFSSQDLDRAAALFERYEGVHFDLSPGIELLYNLSKDVPGSREFFERYSRRIVFGTDIWGTMTVDEAAHRAGIVRRWLETDDEFRVPEGADFLLGPPEDGVMRGLALSEGALANIHHANFERLVGPTPKPLDRELVIHECERIAAESREQGGNDDADEALRVLRRLSSSGR